MNTEYELDGVCWLSHELDGGCSVMDLVLVTTELVVVVVASDLVVVVMVKGEKRKVNNVKGRR